MPDLDEVGHAFHGARGVLEEDLLLGWAHQAEELAGLGVIVGIVLAEVPGPCRTGDREERLSVFRLLLPFAKTVGLVADGRTGVAVHAHLPVAVRGVRKTSGTVDRDLVVVDAQPVALCVPVGEEAPLQHLIGREADARHHGGRVERRLLHILEVVIRVPVQLEHTHLDQGELPLVPDFGEVEGVVGHALRLFFGHHLDEHRPAGEIAPLDALKQVTLVALAVFGDDRLGLLIGQVLDALLGMQVEFDPDAFVFRVDHAERVTAKAVHVAIGEGDPAVAHGDGHLVQRLGKRRPEVPVVGRRAHVGAGVALDGAVEVRELVGVAYKEDGSIVSDQVPVPLLGVELNSKATDVAFGIGCTALAGDRREAHEDLSLLAYPGEEPGLGEPGDVVGDGELAESAGSLGVHTPLRDHLPVEVSELLLVPDVLHQHGAAWAGGHGVLVVRHGCTGSGGQFLFTLHNLLLESLCSLGEAGQVNPFEESSISLHLILAW